MKLSEKDMRALKLGVICAVAIVLFLLGMVGSSITEDAPIIVAVMAVPLVTLAGLGGKLGELFSIKERKR